MAMARFDLLRQEKDFAVISQKIVIGLSFLFTEISG
jgi:hypothetical protein